MAYAKAYPSYMAYARVCHYLGWHTMELTLWTNVIVFCNLPESSFSVVIEHLEEKGGKTLRSNPQSIFRWWLLVEWLMPMLWFLFLWNMMHKKQWIISSIHVGHHITVYTQWLRTNLELWIFVCLVDLVQPRIIYFWVSILSWISTTEELFFN